MSKTKKIFGKVSCSLVIGIYTNHFVSISCFYSPNLAFLLGLAVTSKILLIIDVLRSKEVLFPASLEGLNGKQKMYISQSLEWKIFNQ